MPSIKTSEADHTRWAHAQVEAHDDGCQCVHVADETDSPLADEPQFERLAELIAQRG